MKSKTSLFSPALFRKNLTRFAPLWGIFLGILVLTGPVALLNLNNNWSWDRTIDLWEDFFGFQRGISVFYNAGYALLCAALVFRYLHNPRAAYMMHAFPLNRSTQYVTNTLSGLSFAVVPYLLQFVLNLLASIGMRGTACLSQLLAVQLLSFLFFYGLAVFCMLISGNTAIAVLSYAALNFIFAAIPALLLGLLQSLVFGFDISVHEDLLVDLAPFVQMVRGSSLYRAVAWTPYLVYAGIGCVLLVLSWLHYRVRHIEQAGEAMAHKWARVAFLLVFTLGVTLGLGLILTLLLSGNFLQFRGAFFVLLLSFCIASLVGWFGAEMMLKRTVKVFHKRQWLGWAVFAAVVVVLLCCVRFDVLGFQRYVPAQNDVKDMTVSVGTSNYISDYSQAYDMQDNLDAHILVTDEADIAAMREIHQNAYRTWVNDGDLYGPTISVTYTLQNGRSVTRKFSLADGDVNRLAKALSDPAYALAYYEKLLDAVAEKTHYSPSRGVVLESWTSEESYVCNDKAAVREALLTDAAEGKLPISIYYDAEEYHLVYDGVSIAIPPTAAHTLALFDIEKP